MFKRKKKKMICDACSGPVRVGSGYILHTRDVVDSPAYWEQSLKKLKQLGATLSLPMVARVVGEMASKQSPWFICDDCIELFESDRGAARQAASQFWERGETPEGGAADREAAFVAAVRAFQELTKDDGFPLSWPHR